MIGHLRADRLVVRKVQFIQRKSTQIHIVGVMHTYFACRGDESAAGLCMCCARHSYCLEAPAWARNCWLIQRLLLRWGSMRYRWNTSGNLPRFSWPWHLYFSAGWDLSSLCLPNKAICLVAGVCHSVSVRIIHVIKWIKYILIIWHDRRKFSGRK